MTNNSNSIKKQIKTTGQKLEMITSFKYQGLVVSDDDSMPEILSRITQTTAALTRLKPVWNDKSIFSQFQHTTDTLPCHIHLPVCL